MTTYAVEVVYRGIFQKSLSRNICRSIVLACRLEGKIGTAFGRYGDSPERNGIPAKYFAVVADDRYRTGGIPGPIRAYRGGRFYRRRRYLVQGRRIVGLVRSAAHKCPYQARRHRPRHLLSGPGAVEGGHPRQGPALQPGHDQRVKGASPAYGSTRTTIRTCAFWVRWPGYARTW